MQNLELKHLDQASISSTQLTIDALARIAPSCITEVKDSKTGSIKHAVDFRVLRQLLGDNTVEDAAEAYQFTWVGKQEARRETAKSITKTLRPVPEDSVDWDNTQNIYIEGDNLEALKLLQKSYLGKVKMIYIDPPYNTGNDFVYHDDFKQSQSEYDEAAGNVDEEGNRLVSRSKGSNGSDLEDAFKKNTDSNGRFHSDWCSMIYSRLMIARSLLTEDGVIFISIDDNEVENLRKICDEVFGEANNIETVIWKNKYGAGAKTVGFISSHEYILCYSKNPITELTCEFEGEERNKYTKTDEKFETRGPYRTQPLMTNSLGDRPNLMYSIFHNGVEIKPHKQWVWSKERMDKAIENNDVEFSLQKDGSYTVRSKSYLYDENGNIRRGKPVSILNGPFTQEGTKEMRELFNGKSIFDFTKPSTLIEYFLKLEINNNSSKDSLILDFFSGSATTAHAVMQLNAEDGGNRRFIMVQLPEETGEGSEAYKAGYMNICEIGKERIRRAGAKIKEDLAKSEADNKGKEKEKGLFDGDGNGNNNGNENGNGESSSASSLDTGFRVFRIDSGNMKDVEQSPSDIKQTELDWFIDNVKDDRTELDLLFGCMLNWGVQLSLPMSMETVDGCNIYTVNEGDLVACLTKDKPVTENIVRAIAEKSPLRVLFRDGSFASDAAKINIFEQFKQLMDWSDDEIIKNVRVL